MGNCWISIFNVTDQLFLLPVTYQSHSQIIPNTHQCKSGFWDILGTRVPGCYILKYNQGHKCSLVSHLLIKKGSYKYTSKHVNYVLIQFMRCVLKYQLPPTATTHGQSQHEYLFIVYGTSCGDGPVANADKLSKCHQEVFPPHFILWRQRPVIRFCHRAGR